MSKLKINLACWDYDRTRALMDGRVQIDGVDLNYFNLPVEETFFRMLRNREFDVAEMSLSSYTVSLFRDSPFIAIPIFPSRMFRHSCIYVNADAGINSPTDLIGKKIGTPEYQMTAPVWIRGTLAEHYGVPIDSVTYYTGGEEEPGRPEKLKLDLPERIKIQPIEAHQTLSSMLETGEIDALHTARAPSSFYKKNGKVKRLFTNFQDVELDYYRQTGIFPIMHTLVMRRELYESNRWLAQSLYKAFVESQRHAYEDLRETAALKIMHPLLLGSLETAIDAMGQDFWPYGFEENRATLSKFLNYHYQSGLSKSLLKPEDLFAPEALESFKI
ncbi:MAG: ABC transporter substrate-binding protein [Pigmentiphaga sp.]